MDELLFLTRCIVTWFCVCSCGSVVGLHKLRWVGINIFRGHSFYYFSPFLNIFFTPLPPKPLQNPVDFFRAYFWPFCTWTSLNALNSQTLTEVSGCCSSPVWVCLSVNIIQDNAKKTTTKTKGARLDRELLHPWPRRSRSYCVSGWTVLVQIVWHWKCAITHFASNHVLTQCTTQLCELHCSNLTTHSNVLKTAVECLLQFKDLSCIVRNVGTQINIGSYLSPCFIVQASLQIFHLL